jgi:hypothetical protein
MSSLGLCWHIKILLPDTLPQYPVSVLEIPATIINIFNPINIFIYGGTPKEFWFKSCCNLTSGTHP